MKSTNRSKTHRVDSLHKKKTDRQKEFRDKNHERLNDDNSDNYLMDTNILYAMYSDSSIYEKLKNHSNKKMINLHIVTQINNEFKFLIDNKPPEEYDELQDDQKKDDQKKNDFKKTLKKLGRLNPLESLRSSKIWASANEFSKTKGKKYKNYNGQGLSVADCVLLKYYLTYPKCELITNDGPLKTAAREEGKNFRTKMIFDPLL